MSFSPPSGVQKCGVEIEKLLFSSSTLKKQLIASQEVAANNHFPSPESFKGGEKEKSFSCLVSLCSIVSCGFVYVCSINVSVCFLFKKNNSLFMI